MGIFFNGNRNFRMLYEADEEEDFTSGVDKAGDDDNEDSGGDDSEDFTSGVDSAGDDDGGTDDSSDTDDGGEDFTDGVDSAGDDDSGDEESSESDGEDFTAGVSDAGEGDETGEESDGGDDSEDFTSGVDSAGEGEDDGGDESSGEDSENDSESEEESDSEESTNTSEELKNIESELFSNLTPEQIAIRNTTLKTNFIELYKTIGSVLVRINDIPKTDDNNQILQFVTEKLLDLREMIDFNITTAYTTRTYIENNIIYQQCLSTLNAIADIITNLETHDTNIANMKAAEADEEEEELSLDDDVEDGSDSALNISDDADMGEYL